MIVNVVIFYESSGVTPSKVYYSNKRHHFCMNTALLLMMIIILIIASTQVLNGIIGKVNLIGPYTSQSAQARNSNCSFIRQIPKISDWSVIRVNFTT